MSRFWDWLRAKDVENRDWSISDLAFAEHFGLSAVDSGAVVNETTALGHTAIFRAISIVAGTVATLPLKSYLRTKEGELRKRTSTFLDDPGGVIGLSPFEWKELVMVHLLLHGNAFLFHVYNGAGAIVALEPVHPKVVSITLPGLTVGAGADGLNKIFSVTMADGSLREFTELDITHVKGMGSDGIRGYSPIHLMRNAIGIGLSGEKAAGRMFRNGLLLGGLVTTEEDINEEEAAVIKASFLNRAAGAENAGGIAFVNRTLKFEPWTMNAEESQFNESRAFSIEEVSRMFGVPPHLLAQTEKQTSWGEGVESQNRGLARYTLDPWTSRLEEKLSGLLSRSAFCEFDFKELLRPSPEEEIRLLLEQVAGGLLTVDEARAVLNMAPMTEVTDAPTPV